MNSPSVFVRCNSGFVQIVFNFFQILSSTHRVHGCEEHWLPVPSEAFCSQDQSTSDYGVHFISVPDVVDVLGKVIRQQYIVLQCRINDTTSWTSLKSLGSTRICRTNKDSSIIEICSSLLSLLPGKFPNHQLSIAKCQQTLPWILQSVRQVVLLHRLFEECSYHVAVLWSWTLTLQNNDDRIVVDQCLSISFHEQEPPCAYKQFNVLNGNFFWRVCDVFIDPIHNTNPWNCSVFKQWFDHDINATTSVVRIDFHFQHWVDYRIRTNPPSRSGCFEISRLCVFSKREEVSIPNFL